MVNYYRSIKILSNCILIIDEMNVNVMYIRIIIYKIIKLKIKRFENFKYLQVL